MSPYYTLSQYYKEIYGEKVYKIALNANLSCPNRDGTIDYRGCIFCSEGGSGDFASDYNLSISDQIEAGKKLLSNKNSGIKYVAYFQAFTNTYGELEYLRRIYNEALNHPDIVGISIATRPDCLNEEVISLLSMLNQRKKIWVELGLQTINEKTADLIRRGYPLACFDKAVLMLHKHKLDTVVHLILGLPYETKEDILNSIAYVVSKPIHGIKLQLLHILKSTDLEALYINNPFHIFSLEEYANLIVECIEHIPKSIVIHRITGDGPKKLLVAPEWSKNKKVVLNTIHKCFKNRNSYQGKKLDQI